MLLHFFKYQAAGNDFIIIDTTQQNFPQDNYDLVKSLCDRHFGIGADGLILYKPHKEYDFEMIYYNSDGLPATMCGNGGRSIVSFAYEKKYITKTSEFLASDGLHFAHVISNNNIKLKMSDVNKIMVHTDGYEIFTGSPHFVKLANIPLNEIDVNYEGKLIRNQSRFGIKGVNVNFIEMIDSTTVAIRTYERGVENETLACGTGSVAAAIVAVMNKNNGNHVVTVKALGGTLKVYLHKEDKNFKDIWLEGPAKKVFEGTIEI